MKPELKSDIEKALKTLRQADNQAAAVAWMTNAYKLLEACLKAQDEPRFVFAPEKPKLQIVQNITKAHLAELKGAYAKPKQPGNETVVYPSIYLPPGLKPLPKPWTREDTRRLERAAATPVKRIQRLGK